MTIARAKKYYIPALVIANLIPPIGALMHQWDWDWLLYFYWGECVLIGMTTLLVYLKHLLVFFLLLFAALGILVLSGHNFGSDLRIPLMFWGVYSLCWLVYFEAGNSFVGIKLRRLHPMLQFSAYITFMCASIITCLMLATAFYPDTQFYDLPHTLLLSYLLVAALVPTLAIIILKIVRIIGEHHFLHFLLGSYHRPVELERVVLFMDMIGSTRIAEKLSPTDSMRLISQFIFDASVIIRRNGGDILNYTGDGLVVLWPVEQADRAIAAVYAMRSQFERTRHSYERTFGVKPYFRMGMHAGTVIISQIGEEKLFLGLYGDTVNAASRIEQLNKELDTKVLISETVRQWLSPVWMDRLQSLGLQKISGRQEQLEIFTVILKPQR